MVHDDIIALCNLPTGIPKAHAQQVSGGWVVPQHDAIRGVFDDAAHDEAEVQRANEGSAGDVALWEGACGKGAESESCRQVAVDAADILGYS